MTTPSVAPQTEKLQKEMEKGPSMSLSVILAYLLFGSMVMTIALSVLTSSAQKIPDLIADDIRLDPGAFIFEKVEPAEQLIEIMHYPVNRAAFVPTTPDGPHKGLICAEEANGQINLFRFTSARSGELIRQVTITKDLEVVLPAFCKKAFSRLD